MSICPHCTGENPAGAILCNRCGKPLTGIPGTASQAPTIRYAGPALATRGELRRTTPLSVLFARRERIRIGRSADCDVCLSHPMISRQHALLERLPDGRLRLTGLESINGISVNGQRITEATIVPDNVPVGIGPFLFTANAGHLYTIDNSRSLRLEAHKLE